MPTSKILTSHIASRQRSVDFWGLWNILPDPDPVLRKMGKDITVYKDLLSDPHLWACVQSFKSGIMSKEYEILQPEQTSGKRLNKKTLDFTIEVFNNLNIQKIISEILDAFLFGIAPLEVFWSKDYRIEDIQGKPPEWFIYSPENEYRFLSFDSQLYGEELPPKKFLIPRYFPTYENPYGERLLSKCFWSVTFKRNGLKFWNLFTEKYGMPIPIGKMPGVATDEERAILLDNLKQMVADSVAVINDDESIEILSTSLGAVSVGIYNDLINFCNTEISKAILGQNLSTEMTQGGSYAAMKGALTVRDDIIQMGEKLVCQTLNQAIQWLTEFNFAGALSPQFGFYQEEDSQKELAERDKILTDAGVKFTKEYYKKTYNFEDNDFEISEPQKEQQMIKEPEKEIEEKDEKDIEEKAEFSEKGFNIIDDVTTDAVKKTAPVFNKKLTPLINRIQIAKSFNEIQELLYVWFQDVDTKEFQELVSQAMYFASLTGFETADAELESSI